MHVSSDLEKDVEVSLIPLLPRVHYNFAGHVGQPKLSRAFDNIYEPNQHILYET